MVCCLRCTPQRVSTPREPQRMVRLSVTTSAPTRRSSPLPFQPSPLQHRAVQLIVVFATITCWRMRMSILFTFTYIHRPIIFSFQKDAGLQDLRSFSIESRMFIVGWYGPTSYSNTSSFALRPFLVCIQIMCFSSSNSDVQFAVSLSDEQSFFWANLYLFLPF
ncbi:hypothetical protein ARMGADRAFT_733865 [Armillaria gallica]|uniref:Uncharacterized protein n=1 Tax=Armillaria gallica TaxID=47427 RepID=A0A2H3CHF7_ARMGA|nr:hypothetical protein ARMGADRAFT_733865 [Armillaria gallica]